MKINDILHELNLKGKEGISDILNEPINCGFEAEILWKNTFDNSSPKSSNINNIGMEYGGEISWEEIKDRLEILGEHEIVKRVEKESLERIKGEIEDDEDDDEESVLKQDLENDQDKTIEQEITSYTNMTYDSDYIQLIKDVMDDVTREFNIPNFITNEWIMKHSFIKKSESKWTDYSKNRLISNIDNDSWVFDIEETIKTGYGTGMEIISPVYPSVSIMLNDMKSLFKWLTKEGATTNNTTGLHITMSMAEPQKTEINKLKLCVLTSDTNILRNFDRSENTYTEGIVDAIVKDLEDLNIQPEDLHNLADVEKRMNEHRVSGKHVSVNFKYEENQAGSEMVEFRAPGGDKYMTDEFFKHIYDATKRYATCLKSSYSNTYHDRAYKKMLGKLIQKVYHNEVIEVDDIKKRVYPFIGLMKDVMFSKNFRETYDTIRAAYKELEHSDAESRMHAKKYFMYSFVRVCADIGAKNFQTGKDHYRIAKETMEDFGIKEINQKTLYRLATSDFSIGGTHSREEEDKQISRQNRFRIVMQGYNMLMKRKMPLKYAVEDKPVWNIYENGHIVMEKHIWSTLKNLRSNYYDLQDEDYTNFFDFSKNGFVNKNKTIFLIPDDCMRLINLAYRWESNDWPNERENWEMEVVNKIETHFSYNYGKSYLELINEIKENSKIHFTKNDYDTFINTVNDIFEVNIIPAPKRPFMTQDVLIGPNGEQFGYFANESIRLETKEKNINVKLNQIVNELNTRSKKTEPGIFNEPIECGFEAEIVWTDIKKKNKIDFDHAWEIVSDSLPEDMLNKVYAYARGRIESKIEEEDEEIEAEEQTELESFLEDMKEMERDNYEGEGEYNEDSFDEERYTEFFYEEKYERPENEYKRKYEEDEIDFMNDLIIEEVDGVYDGSTRNFLANVTDIDVYDDEDEFEYEEKERVIHYIIDNWVMKHSHIKDAKNHWGLEDEGYDEDERFMWHFADDGSIDAYGDEGAGLEIMSPVYPNLNTMFEDMESLFLWLLHQKATTNDSTGLHITLNLAEPQENNLNKMKLYTLASDDNILNDFGREYNTNVVSITSIIRDIIRRYAMPKNIFDIKDFNNIENILTKNIGYNKYRSINVRPNRSANGNEMVEFRSAGGEHYLNKIKLEDVKNAIKHYAVCLKAAYNDVDYQRDYKNLLYRLIRRAHDYNEEEYETKGRDEYITKGKTYPFIYLMQKTMYPNHYYRFVQEAKKILYSDDDLDHDIDIKYKFMVILCQMCLDIHAKKIKTNSTHYKIIKKTMNDIGIEKIEPKDLHSAMFGEITANSSDIRTDFDCHNVLGNVLTEIFRFEPELYQHENNFRITLSAYSDGQIAIKSELWELLKRGGNDTKILYKHFIFGNKHRNKEKTILVIPDNYLQYAKFVDKWYAGDWSHTDKRFWQNEVDKIKDLFGSEYNLTVFSVLEFLNNEEFFDKDRYKELIDVMDKNNIEVKLDTSPQGISRYIKNPIIFESIQAKINTNMKEGIAFRKNFKRNKMPQINKQKLIDSPFEIKTGVIDIDNIIPVQTERVEKHISRAIELMTQKNYKRLIVDKDNYLVNGHHRYDAAKKANLDKIRIIKVNATIEDLMKYFKHTVKDEKVMQEKFKLAIRKILAETTGVGGIASVAVPLGAPIKRPNPSIYKTTSEKKNKKKKKTKKQVAEMYTAKTKNDIDTYISGVESKIYSAIKQKGFIAMNQFNESEMEFVNNLLVKDVIEKVSKNHLVGFRTHSTIL